MPSILAASSVFTRRGADASSKALTSDSVSVVFMALFGLATAQFDSFGMSVTVDRFAESHLHGWLSHRKRLTQSLRFIVN